MGGECDEVWLQWIEQHVRGQGEFWFQRCSTSTRWAKLEVEVREDTASTDCRSHTGNVSQEFIFVAIELRGANESSVREDLLDASLTLGLGRVELG